MGIRGRRTGQALRMTQPAQPTGSRWLSLMVLCAGFLMIVVDMPVEDHPGWHREGGGDHRAGSIRPRVARLSVLRHDMSSYAVGVRVPGS